MSHHSQDGTLGTKIAKLIGNADLRREMSRKQQLLETLGPTGKFPDGKMAPHDEGELMFAIGCVNGKVTLDFGKPVHGVGMTPTQAMALAQMLIKKARSANIIGANKEPLVLEIGG